MSTDELVPGIYFIPDPLQMVVVFQPPDAAGPTSLIYPITPTQASAFAAMLLRTAAKNLEVNGRVKDSFTTASAQPKSGQVQ